MLDLTRCLDAWMPLIMTEMAVFRTGVNANFYLFEALGKNSLLTTRCHGHRDEPDPGQ